MALRAMVREDGGMDAQAWNERYAAADLVWSSGPNGFVEELLTPLVEARPTGSALDVGAGRGATRSGWRSRAGA